MPKMNLKQNYRYTDGTLYRAGRDVEVPSGFADWLKGKSSEEAAPASVGSTGGTADRLEGVRFASSAARTAAEEAGMVAADFDGVKSSSADGYTKPDVQKIIDAQDGSEED